MGAKYKEIRHLSAETLRALCVSLHWFTRGNNEQYEHLLMDLAEAKENLSCEDIIEIAEDIAAYSVADGRTIEDIAFIVNQACVTRFVKL